MSYEFDVMERQVLKDKIGKLTDGETKDECMSDLDDAYRERWKEEKIVSMQKTDKIKDLEKKLAEANTLMDKLIKSETIRERKLALAVEALRNIQWHLREDNWAEIRVFTNNEIKKLSK